MSAHKARKELKFRSSAQQTEQRQTVENAKRAGVRVECLVAAWQKKLCINLLFI